jgi:hypothetical protein
MHLRRNLLPNVRHQLASLLIQRDVTCSSIAGKDVLSVTDVHKVNYLTSQEESVGGPRKFNVEGELGQLVSY